MKKLSVLLSIITIISLCFLTMSFRKTTIIKHQKEVEDIRDILSKGYVKILSVDYDESVIVGALPDGTKKRVHVIFAERKPSVDELWRVVEHKGRLKLTTQYIP